MMGIKYLKITNIICINVRENHKGNQEWTIQRYSQQDTECKQTKNTTPQSCSIFPCISIHTYFLLTMHDISGELLHRGVSEDFTRLLVVNEIS